MDMPPSQPVKLPPVPELSVSAGRPARSGGPQVRMSGSVVSLDVAKASPADSAVPAPKTGAGAPAPGDASAVAADEISKMIAVANPVQGYHIQAARDQGFSDIALDRTYDVFDHINLADYLPPGTYWVRISYIDLLGFEGKYNVPRQVKVSR